MSFRWWLAGKICPEMKKSALMWDHAWYVLYPQADRWLGEFPRVCAALEWVMVGTKDYFRPLAVHAQSKWSPWIECFRKQLHEMGERR